VAPRSAAPDETRDADACTIGPTMKLAEALMLRSDLQKKVASLRERTVANAVVQQGDEPHEAPAQLIAEALGVLAELEKLIIRINEANLETKLADGMTITQAIARRDTLIQQHSLLTAAIAGCRREPARYGMSEIKWVATLEVAKLQKQADDVSKAIREMNTKIQAANWATELKG
jgi:hypothetical protein